VLLPEPLGPKTTINSRSATSSVSPCNATDVPCGEE
jgi:hypothetical protein